MGRLMTGVAIILFVAVINTFAAFVAAGTASTSEFSRCTTQDNFTTCQDVGKGGFLSAIFSTTFLGFDGAPDFINAIWGLIMGLLLTAAILLIVLSFVPLTAE